MEENKMMNNQAQETEVKVAPKKSIWKWVKENKKKVALGVGALIVTGAAGYGAKKLYDAGYDKGVDDGTITNVTEVPIPEDTWEAIKNFCLPAVEDEQVAEDVVESVMESEVEVFEL